MSFADIDEIYEKLLQIYKVRYPHNPRRVLSYKIIELVREGKTREKAILNLYEEEGKIARAEAEELEEAIRKKKEEAIEQQIKEHKKSKEKLTLLFSKGELNEESYKAAIKPLEEKIATLESEKKESFRLPAPSPIELPTDKEEKDYVVCSSCGNVLPSYRNYCPTCGAIVKRPLLLIVASGFYLLNVILLIAAQLYLIFVGIFNLAAAIGLFYLRERAGYWALGVSLPTLIFFLVVFIISGNPIFLVLSLTHLLPALIVIKKWDSLI